MPDVPKRRVSARGEGGPFSRSAPPAGRPSRAWAAASASASAGHVGAPSEKVAEAAEGGAAPRARARPESMPPARACGLEIGDARRGRGAGRTGARCAAW